MDRSWASSLCTGKISYGLNVGRPNSDVVRGYSRKFSSTEVISAELGRARPRSSRPSGRAAELGRDDLGRAQNLSSTRIQSRETCTGRTASRAAPEQKGIQWAAMPGQVLSFNCRDGPNPPIYLFHNYIFSWMLLHNPLWRHFTLVWIMNIDIIHLSTDMGLSTKYWLFKTCMHCWQFFAFYLSCNPEV